MPTPPVKPRSAQVGYAANDMWWAWGQHALWLRQSAPFGIWKSGGNIEGIRKKHSLTALTKSQRHGVIAP